MNMKLRERYRRLTIWNKIQFFGATASILALAIYLLTLFTCNTTPEATNVVTSEAQLQDLLMPANEPDPPHTCTGVPANASKVFMGGCLSYGPPQEDFTVLTIDGQDILVLERESGGCFLSMVLYRQDGRDVARVVRNRFEINPNNYFRLDRPDRHELNIYDKEDRHVLHVRYVNETAFMIQGIFYGPKTKVEVTPDGVAVGTIQFSGGCTSVGGGGRLVHFGF